MHVAIMKGDPGWRLEVDGEDHFVRGAVGHQRLKRLAELGANAVRLGRLEKAALDEAHFHGLGVLAGLPVRAERNGMDYDDEAAVEAQRREVLSVVEAFRTHPAVLMWCIGNELDHIPRQDVFNPKVWPAGNAFSLGDPSRGRLRRLRGIG